MDNLSSAVLTYKKLIRNTGWAKSMYTVILYYILYTYFWHTLYIHNRFLIVLQLFYLQYIQLVFSTTEIIVMHTSTLYTRYM